MFEIKPNLRYDMPVVFGPSIIPDETVFGSAVVATIRFRTERSALETLTPGMFALAADPVVTVAYAMYGDIDYLGGRGYNVVRVALPAIFEGKQDRLAGPYHLVIWESDTIPIVLGREWGGYAKIIGQIPDLEQTADACRFSLHEYGSRLMSGMIDDLKPLPAPDLATLREQTVETYTLGWKYSPGLEGVADADYATKIVTRYRHDEAWTGSGSVEFDRPSWQDAPLSSHILAALNTLPVIEYLPAMLTRGSLRLPRSEVRRLR